MRHVVVNPTWRCQLQCDYCWLPYSHIQRQTTESSSARWAEALVGYLERGDLIDFSGGEPLLYPTLPELLRTLGALGIRWALTTNALRTAAIESLCSVRPRGCVVINVSDHQANADAAANIERLGQAGYMLRVNRVDHPAAANNLVGGSLLPFQDWEHDAALDGVTRQCNAGWEHWAVDPAGNVWRCMVWLQLGRPSLGNLFDGTFIPLEEAGHPCDTGCSTCYRETPGDWRIGMRVL